MNLLNPTTLLFLLLLLAETVALIWAARFFFSKGDMIYMSQGADFMKRLGFASFVTALSGFFLRLLFIVPAYPTLGAIPGQQAADAFFILFTGSLVLLLSVILSIVMKLKSTP